MVMDKGNPSNITQAWYYYSETGNTDVYYTYLLLIQVQMAVKILDFITMRLMYLSERWFRSHCRTLLIHQIFYLVRKMAAAIGVNNSEDIYLCQF
jgi:hypothetical protein